MKFNVDFTQVICKFLLWRPAESSRFNCSIVYGTFADNSQTFYVTETSLSDTVILDLSTNIILTNVVYQFSVTATDGTIAAAVEGTFNKHEGNRCS